MKNLGSIKNSSSRPLNIMLVDFAYYNRYTTYSQYTPLSIGMIAQYTKQEFKENINVSLFKNLEKFFIKASENPPDVVGFAVYHWNTAITQYALKRLKQMFGKNVVTIVGGPSIDTDQETQLDFMTKVFPNVDAIITNEGELGFNNILKRILGKKKNNIFKDPIDGVSFLDGNKVIKGLPIGLTMDLEKMGSPYLSGLMDEFMNSNYQPLIQTSRFCPYTCAFCVSGKNRGKLRGYPIEQVREELRYIAKKYVDRPHHTLYMADENFGILKRDVEIAEDVKKCKDDIGYPQSVFFYNDKRFTQISRKVLEILKDMTQFGVILALQTEDPSALQAINRRNITDAEIDDALKWAKELGLETSTDLIFGLPHETRDSFVKLLNRSIYRGFDSVRVNNLYMLHGIEMNRPQYRKKYSIKTKFRPLASSYESHNNNFFAEHEEVVVATDTFSYNDFLEVRNMNFMFVTVFNHNFQKYFFHYLSQLNISLSNFFAQFTNPNKKDDWPENYLTFLNDLKKAIEGELHDTREEMITKLKKDFENNNNKVLEPSRINMNFAARINYLENDWIKPVLIQHLKNIKSDLSKSQLELVDSLITLSLMEKVDLRESSKKEPLTFSYDVINWKNSKFQKPLQKLNIEKKFIKFLLDDTQKKMLDGFKNKFSTYENKDFYNAAVEFIKPRRYLLHTLAYK